MSQAAIQIPVSGERYNLGEILHASIQKRGSNVVLRCAGRDCTASELADLVLTGQALLTELGLTPGDRVLLMIRDTPAFYAGFIGAIRGGFVPVPVATLLPPGDVSFIARDADVRAVLLDEALPEALRDPSLYPARARLVLTRDWDLAGAAQPPRRELAPQPVDADDPCFWLYTSGSTGKPKGVIHRHGSIPVATQLYAQQILGIRPDDVILSAPKLYFGYGLGNSLLFPLLLGARVILNPERPTPESTFELIRRERPSIFFGVPTLYARMLGLAAAPSQLDSLRLCVSAGEALGRSLCERWWARYNIPVLDGLGMTEMLHIFLSNRPDDVRAGASGRVVPGYEVRIVDEEGRDVPDGKPGTLLVGGLTRAIRYHNRESETARTMFKPGWVRTGDSYWRDPDGYYHHLGRTDDLIKVSGQFVSPLEVEETLMQHPDVLEAAVVAFKDEHGLLQPKAFVVLRNRGGPDQELAGELKSFVKGRLTPHKYPRVIEFVEALPRTGTGKIQRYVLRHSQRSVEEGSIADRL